MSGKTTMTDVSTHRSWRLLALVVAATLALLLSWIRTGHAESLRDYPPQSVMTHLLRAVPVTRQYRPPTNHPRLAGLLENLTPPGDASSPAVLQIPWNAWPDGTGESQSGVMSSTEADNPNSNFFASSTFHHTSYSDHGMHSGYAQQAYLNLERVNGTIEVDWLGSFYSDANLAASRVMDAVDTLHRQSFKDQPCFLANESNCHLFIFPIPVTEFGSGFALHVLYAIWSNGNVVGELAFLGESSNMIRNASAVGHDFQSLLAESNATVNAAVGGAPPATGNVQSPPADPTISITGVQVLHYVGGKLVATSTLQLHQTAYFVSTFHLSGVGTYTQSGDLRLYSPGGSVRIIEHTFKEPDRTIYDRTATYEVAPDNGTPFFDLVGTFDDPRDEGSLTVQFSVNLGKASDQKSLDFSLQARTLHCKKGYRAQYGTCFKKK